MKMPGSGTKPKSSSLFAGARASAALGVFSHSNPLNRPADRPSSGATPSAARGAGAGAGEATLKRLREDATAELDAAEYARFWGCVERDPLAAAQFVAAALRCVARAHDAAARKRDAALRALDEPGLVALVGALNNAVTLVDTCARVDWHAAELRDEAAWLREEAAHKCDAAERKAGGHPYASGCGRGAARGRRPWRRSPDVDT